MAAFAPYHPIEPVSVLAERYGLDPGSIAKLDANENPWGPVPAVLDAIRDAQAIQEYPDPGATALRLALEAHTGVPAAQIVAGNGSDELLDLLVRVLVEPGDMVVTAPPTFAMYRFYAELAQARLVTVPRDADFQVDPDRLVAAARDARLVMLANPNNPTGDLLPGGVLERLLGTGAVVVMDEAYAEFSGVTALGHVPLAPNLVVLRTFSKWAGLAGLRLGYLAGPAWLVEAINRIRTPYNVNVAAQRAGLAVLRSRDEAMRAVRKLVVERDRMAARLHSQGVLGPLPSAANFLLCRVRPDLDAGLLQGRLARTGVFVRHYTEPALLQTVRISAGRPQDTDRLLAALETIREA